MARPTRRPRRCPPSPTPSSYSSQQPSSSGPNAQPSLSYDSSDREDTRTPSSSSPSFFYSRSDSSATTSSSSSSAPSTYVPVAPLPVFRGSPDECPVSHLTRFARVCRANNASTPEIAARIFPVTLDGEAALWYELAIEPEPSLSLSWDDIKSMFLNAYQRLDKSTEELMSLKQAENERVRTFYLRMQWILRKWPQHGVPDEMLRGIFVDGLREEFREWVVLQRPSSLEEAFRVASAWEEARRRKGKEDRGGRPCGFCGGGGHEEKGCEVRRRMREMWVRIKEEGLLSRSASGLKEQLGEKVGRSQQQYCACWKHQCWKRLERSASVAAVDRPPPSTPTPPTAE